MAAPSLTGATLPLQSLKSQAEKELSECLDSMRGKKALVLDPSISGPLGLITEKQLLKDKGVERTYHLSKGNLDTDQRQILYIVRADIPSMKIIADQIHAHIKENMTKEYKVLLVPRKSIICERVLEEEGVYGNVSLGEFAMDLIPVEEDVLSMEMPMSFRECFLEQDRTSMYYVARAIMKMQAAFGGIPVVRGKGVCSKAVMDLLIRMKRESGYQELPGEQMIDELVMIDRNVDMVTPMLTQLTYEGLIDEVFRINNGIAEVDPSMVAAQQQGQAPKRVKVALNSNDKVFQDLRDSNFSIVGTGLKKRALLLQQVEQERHKLQGQGVSEIKDYVKRLKEMNIQQEKSLLSLHTNMASEIGKTVRDPTFNRRLEAEQSMLLGRDSKVMDFVEEHIYKQEPFLKSLRLLCLSSILNSGVRKIDHFRKELVQSYGFEAILTLSNLEKAGLLRKQEGRAWWSSVRKSMNLMKEDIDETKPEDIAYVYSGYAPLSVRLAHAALQGGQAWKSAEEATKSLPGPSFDERLTSSTGPGAGSRKTSIVFILGGATFTEIAALRWIAKKEGITLPPLIAVRDER